MSWNFTNQQLLYCNAVLIHWPMTDLDASISAPKDMGIKKLKNIKTIEISINFLTIGNV